MSEQVCRAPVSDWVHTELGSAQVYMASEFGRVRRAPGFEQVRRAPGFEQGDTEFVLHKTDQNIV